MQVTLLEARNLPVWGFPWQSNPYCRIEVGSQSFRSRKEDATSHAGSHRAPVWNQEFQFLVEDPSTQVDFHIRQVFSWQSMRPSNRSRGADRNSSANDMPCPEFGPIILAHIALRVSKLVFGCRC